MTSTEARWRELLREQARAGLSVLEFARQRGLAPSTVYWWRSRIRRQATEQTKLVAVDVVADRPDEGRGISPPIEIQIGRDVVIRVQAGVDEADLQAVLRAVGHRC